MIGVLFSTQGVPVFQSQNSGEIIELVRGNEQLLLERFLPLVREQSITLDLRQVERIDAAGLAALIRLFCTARDTGHNFSVAHPTEHVAELLALVRLDGLLIAKSTDDLMCSRFSLQESAA